MPFTNCGGILCSIYYSFGIAIICFSWEVLLPFHNKILSLGQKKGILFNRGNSICVVLFSLFQSIFY